MDIEAIVKKLTSAVVEWDKQWSMTGDGPDIEEVIRATLTELSETHALEMRAYEATVQNQAERIRQLEATVAEYDRRIVAVGGVAINSVSREHHDAEVARLNGLYQQAVAGRQAFREKVRELEAQRVPDGWKSWRDVAVHGYPKAAQEVLFVRNGKTVHGAFIGGIFWHSNERCAAALWMPLPTPLTPDAHRAMLAAHRRRSRAMTDNTKMRAEFEEWALKHTTLCLDRHKTGNYMKYASDTAWRAWQANAPKKEGE